MVLKIYKIKNCIPAYLKNHTKKQIFNTNKTNYFNNTTSLIAEAKRQNKNVTSIVV